ncbi:MAG: hypothetical protein JNJ59_19470, partial [Deltaproteobacteria bacterium]|nr:hypothetical protein [Deltaproteobacteria bacterium]
MSGRRTLFGALLLSLLSIAGVARAQTATLEVLQPGAAGVVVPDTQYDLRVNFAFAGGDVQNPQLVIDLPPGVIVVDVGVFSSFTGSCVAEDPQTGNMSYYDANQNWKCTFATNLIEVPSGGVSGQIPLRVRFMPFFYTNLQQVTLSATMSGANFQSVSASAVATVTTTLGFNENYWTHQGVGWTKQNDASPVGSLIYHARSPDNSGSAFVYPGVEVRETFPAGTKYLGKIYDQAGWTNSQAAWSAATSMTWTTPFRLGFGYVNAQGNGNLGQKGVIYNNGEYFYSWLYNACGTVATDAQWTSKLFGTTATNGSGFAEFLPSSYPNAFYVSQGGGHYVGSCEDSVQAGFSLGNPAIGTWFYTSLVITPPAGAVPVYEMFASYALPAGLEYRQPDVSAYYYNSGQSTAGFTLYRCNLPASKGVNITKAQFDAAVAANKCPVWDRGSAVVYTESDVTHLVAYSPVLSAAESWGPTVWRNYGITVYVRKNSCGGASEGINYEGYVSAKRTQNGALETTNTGASQTIDNLQYWYTWGYLRNEQGEDVTTQTKGALGHLDVYPQSELGVNPRGFAIFPAGIRYLSAQWHSYNATCDDPDEVVTTTVLPNGTTRIDVDFAPAGSPWNSANDCSATPCKPAGYGYLTLNYYVDPAYPFSDGQIITYSTSFDSENNRYGSPWTSSDALTISVPAEMNLRIEPTCSGAPGSSNRQLGMAARMSNSGGLALTQMVSILPIPKANDGSGTSVSTTYASHTAPAGVTVECSTNNQVSWSSTCNSSATHIRFTAGTIAAYQSVTVQLFLTVPGNTPSGTSIFARGNLDSDQLLPINATSVAPSKVNFCPGRAVVNLWFDEDGDGTRDASEPALSNWPLVLTSSTGEVYNLEFEPDGTLDVALAGGTVGAPQRYTYAVVNPTTGQAVWSWTAAIPADIAVVADGTVTINLPATCACTDNNFCTTDSCNFLGQCAYVPRAPIPNIADAFCDGVDNDCDAQTDEDYAPVQVICGEGVCQSTGMSTCQFGQEDRENGTCVPAWENAENETCDGTDNDCDGLTDAQDESLIQVACEKQLGVCSGSLKQRSMCITTRFGASWQACSDQIYAAYAFPRAYVAANQNKDFCGDPLVATDPTKPSGVDNDCDGSVDEDHVVAATTCGVGACGATGALNCVNGQTVNTCTAGAATSEVCNGKDDDCDGLTDLSDPTITRVNCANQDGVCAGSKKTTCNGVNGWADCTAADYAASAAPNYSSSDTTCDARDNNCSGQVDEGYVGGSVACGVGACAVTGTQVCTGGAVKVRIGQTNYDQCTPNAAASSNEVCDGIDNDCDGLTDAADPSLVLVACELQGGVCAGSQKPRTLCSNGAWQPCTSANYTSHSAQYSVSDATCNGVDNNCVGGVDEGYVTTETVCGVGACRATGTLSCVAGTAVNSCVAGAAGFELCNGVDDDCDGLTDLADPDIVRVDCANQAGVCAGSKKTTCNGASGWAACTDADYAASAAPYYSSTDTTCDNRDNNCSGATDEGYVGASVGCGNGVCAVTGTQVCVAGAVKVRVGQTNYDQCTPNAGAAVNETCDGVDNDCDGLTDASDPSLVRVACELQSGVCSGSLKPVTLCVSGSWQACNSATYTAYSNLYATVDSSCNGVDNDCSDGIDDDYVSASTSCGVGACAATGTRSCVNGSAVDSCQAGAPGALELCNGIDDDCDGKTDLADPDIVRENCA